MDLAALAAALLVCFAVAAAGGLVTARGLASWYPGLRKPAWTPPNGVFGPVWTVLYTAMALAAWLVWRRAGFAGAGLALGLFALQLALNFGWSAVFFARRRPGLAFAEIGLLWASILGTIVAFWRVSPAAGALDPVPRLVDLRGGPELFRLAAQRLSGAGRAALPGRPGFLRRAPLRAAF